MKLGILPVLVIATVLISGLGTVNIQHHLNIPQYFMDKEVIEHHPKTILDIILNHPEVTDIRLKEEIQGTDTVKDIGRILQEAKKGDVIRFHISGYGGEVETVEYLINNIKTSAATTVMIVESPSYSGHAYLAVSGNYLIMLPYSYLMFHTSSAYGTDCALALGTDRTVSNAEHCQKGLEAHMQLVIQFLESVPLFTRVEKDSLESGHDVYLFPRDILFRQTLLRDGYSL